jgi:hypothetical protein
MSSYLNTDRKVLRAEARLILERVLAEPKTAAEKAVVSAKLADVSLTLAAARAGKAVVVPMGWDDDQRALWSILVDYHREGIEEWQRLAEQAKSDLLADYHRKEIENRLAKQAKSDKAYFGSLGNYMAEELKELKEWEAKKSAK